MPATPQVYPESFEARVLRGARSTHYLVGTARRLSRLAPSRRAAVQAWMTSIAMPIKERCPGGTNRSLPLTVSVCGRVHTLHVRDRSELFVVREVLYDEEYDVAPPRPPRVILDLGAHIGVSAIYWVSRFPGIPIIAVEPDPRNAAGLERNVGHLPEVTIVHAAVGHETGTAQLARRRHSWGSNINDGGGMPVPMVTIDSLLHDIRGPVLLKIDVEGSEWDALRSADLSSVDAVVGELHMSRIPVSHETFLGLLSEFTILQDGDGEINHVLCAVRASP
jgi:FkbM family methyltransferase